MWAQVDCGHAHRHYNLRQIAALSTIADTSGIDITKYKLEIIANPDQSSFSGSTTIFFSATSNISNIVLDAKDNLSINSVFFGEIPVTNYTHQDNELNIQLSTSLATDSKHYITVSFSGDANNSTGYYRKTPNNIPSIYTKSEPFDGSSWWVCKDNLTDKADTTEIYITHPSKYKAASIGKLISETDNGDSTTTTFWKHSYPVPVYLIAIAITDYSIYKQNVLIGETSMPIVNYIYPSVYESAINSLNKVPEYIDYFNQIYGEYPYKNEKYGHAQWEWGGGMEHATISFVVDFREDLLVHELMHQWFGDKVTCATWSDIWLNEGFATYGEGLMRGHLYGTPAFRSWRADQIANITSLPDGSVYNTEPENESRIFDSRLTYQKAGMVVHMIKQRLGDELFFNAMKEYLDNPQWAYGFASTGDLKESLMQSTNIDFTEFFNDWVYGEGHPIFSISIDQKDNLETSVRISQATSHNSVSLFETDVDIQFWGDNNVSVTKQFSITENNQNFDVPDIPFKITWAAFDPQSNIIAKKNNITLNNLELSSDYYQSVSVYPNPANDYVYISAPAIINKVDIYNLTSKTVYNLSEINDINYLADIAHLSGGTYVISITLEDGQTKKLKLIKR